jgi:hypothetical protein
MVINAGQCHYAVGDRRSGETTSATFERRGEIALNQEI